MLVWLSVYADGPDGELAWVLLWLCRFCNIFDQLIEPSVFIAAVVCIFYQDL